MVRDRAPEDYLVFGQYRPMRRDDVDLVSPPAREKTMAIRITRVIASISFVRARRLVATGAYRPMRTFDQLASRVDGI